MLGHKKKSLEGERAWFLRAAKESDAESEVVISSLGKSLRLFL